MRVFGAIRILFSCLIIAGLAFVSLITIRKPTLQTTEGRALASFPPRVSSYNELSMYFRDIDSWATDRMHYRQEFITWLTQIRLALGATVFHTVTVGKEHWLFFNGNGEDDDALGTAQFTPEELLRWKNYLLYRNAEVSKYGGTFIFVLLPNKTTIYPEYLPDNFSRVSTRTRLQQIVDAMQGTDVHVIDMRPGLLNAKNVGQLYTKTDTHWNMLGANIAQYQIFETISKILPDLQPTQHIYHYADLQERYQLSQSNDLYRTLGLGYDAPVEYEPLLPVVEGVGKCIGNNPGNIRKSWPPSVGDCSRMTTPAEDPEWFAMVKRGWGDHSQAIQDYIFKSTIYEPGRHTLLVVHDSYFEMLQPYFSNRFKHAYYVFLGRPLQMWVWTGFLESTHPDIAIEEILERQLKESIPRPGMDYPVDFHE